jgi:hypothetical protein
MVDHATLIHRTSCAASEEGSSPTLLAMTDRLRFNCQTASGQAFAFSRRESPELCVDGHPLKTRGRRESRVRAAPAVSCACASTKKAHTSIQVQRETLRPSLRNGFTAYSALSPVNGLSCHRRPAESFAFRGLDASIAASGPHGFAVRACLRSSAASRASTTSHRAFRDDREPPLSSGETGGVKP